MAYPTGILSVVLEDIDRRVIEVKRYCQDVRNESAAGPVPSSRILTLYVNLRQDRAALATLSQTPGLAAYAQAQKNNGTLNVAAEFTNLLSVMDGVTNWINTNFPKDGGGFLLAQTLTADFPLDRTFSTAALATFRTVLDTLIAAIA